MRGEGTNEEEAFFTKHGVGPLKVGRELWEVLRIEASHEVHGS